MAYNNRGVWYGKKDNHEQALNDYNKAIQLNPNLALAYSNRGFIYSKFSKHDLALADHKKALDLVPDSADYQRNVQIAERNLLPEWQANQQGQDALDAKENQKAVDLITQAIEINGNVAQFYNDRGCAYSRLNKTMKAQKDFEMALSLEPENEMYNKNLNLAKEAKTNKITNGISYFMEGVLNGLG
jgi:tetratricopeptide (TPR) repeat protein